MAKSKYVLRYKFLFRTSVLKEPMLKVLIRKHVDVFCNFRLQEFVSTTRAAVMPEKLLPQHGVLIFFVCFCRKNLKCVLPSRTSFRNGRTIVTRLRTGVDGIIILKRNRSGFVLRL
jgi:hypothetical protein